MDLSSLPANDLAKLCSDADSAHAWNEFVRRFQRTMALVVIRTARSWGCTSSSLIDDLVQEAFLRLCADRCKLLRTFVSRDEDSIIGYLKVIAANVTHDYFRAEKSQKRGGHLKRVEDENGDLDFLMTHPSQANPADKAVLTNEIDRALQSSVPDPLTERDRTIFWLCHQQGFTSQEISAIATVGLTVKGVESSLHRTRAHLKHLMSPPPSSPHGEKGFPTPDTILKGNG
jgi:RNA polymerase sigma-70 factor (ECF subfamily)